MLQNVPPARQKLFLKIYVFLKPTEEQCKIAKLYEDEF